jgi:hypothetical protein
MIRYTVARKAELVAQVRTGVTSLEALCQVHILTPDEFQTWERQIDAHGLAGLRVTRTQQYRTPQ